MKNLFTLFILLLSFGLSAQQTITSTIMHDGIERGYILYVPENYTGTETVPLLLNFHGLSSNATEQMFYGDFRSIAETEGFIIAHPEGTEYNGTTHWNVGGFTIGSTVDDIGFTSALLDSISNEYSIDPDRVYSTGMSNGGYMSFLLACQLSNRIAAVASVTGSMTPSTYDECDPQHPTAVLQIHGTADPTVPYTGAIWTKSIDDVLAYWREYNNGPITDRVIEIVNSDTTDGSTVQHTINDSGDREVRVEHYKVREGLHTWPGSAFRFPGTNYDINASELIWEFFDEFDVNGKRGLPVSTQETSAVNISIFPNPVRSFLNVSVSESQNFKVLSVSGESLLSGQFEIGTSQLDLSALKAGLYILSTGSNIYKIVKE